MIGDIVEVKIYFLTIEKIKLGNINLGVETDKAYATDGCWMQNNKNKTWISKWFAKHLAEWAICKELSIEKSAIDFCYNQYGKPYIRNSGNICGNIWNIYFNILHTENIIVVGISDCPIGVDVERIKGGYMNVEKRFLPSKGTVFSIKKSFDKCFCEI